MSRKLIKGTVSFFLFSNDKFCKDVSTCMLSLIPAGRQKIHLDGIARRFVFKSGALQAVKLLSFILFELGGFKPLYHMHSDNRDRDLLKEFNFEGTKRFYLRVAALLKLNARIRGVFGIGWLNDPQLENISPELWRSVEYVVNNGGKLFNLGASSTAKRGATMLSSKRKRLYEEGKYVPKDYMLVWSRKRILSWAERY